VNFAQKMLLIIGEGGEGKSRVGIVLSHLLGSNMINGSLSKLETSPFARADLQGRLLLVDDDLRMEGLRSTNYLKTIITAEQPLDLERKGVQSYQGKVSCRLMAFGNGSLRALHDRSHGFFRRQIILTTKPRREDREDDPYLAAAMKQEREGILMWCIQGLQRLVHNDFQFTVSQRSRENLAQAMKEGNNTLDFMASEGYIRLDQEAEISSRRLYSIYTDWCHDNMAPPLSSRSFIGALITDAHRYGITYTNRINGGNGRLVRGFRGIRGLSRA
jgi:putative DNA primase/helicase